MVSEMANFNDKFANMSIKQKTSYFVRMCLTNISSDYKHCPNEYLSLHAAHG